MDEMCLVHYGVKGMKWGIRKKYKKVTSNNVENSTKKKSFEERYKRSVEKVKLANSIVTKSMDKKYDSLNFDDYVKYEEEFNKRFYDLMKMDYGAMKKKYGG